MKSLPSLIKRRSIICDSRWKRCCLDGTDTPLTESERTALVDRINDLAEWLRGEGDPLGLGEHTDAMESAVIESVGIIGSILLANGVAAIGGEWRRQCIGWLGWNWRWYSPTNAERS